MGAPRMPRFFNMKVSRFSGETILRKTQKWDFKEQCFGARHRHNLAMTYAAGCVEQIWRELFKATRIPAFPKKRLPSNISSV